MPLLVWALTGLNVVFILVCSILYPTWYGYDEPQHVDMAYSFAQGHGLYGPGERPQAIGIRHALHGSGWPPSQPFSPVVGPPRGERPSLDALGGDQPDPRALPNQMVQHPPLYYLMGAGALHLPGAADLPYDRQVALLRGISLLLMTPLPLIAWATATALVGDGPVAHAAAVVPMTVPNFPRTGGTYTNDALIIFATGLVFLLLAHVMSGDLRRRTAAAVGGAVGLALLAKGFALVLPIAVVLGYAVAGLRHRRWPVGPAMLALLVGAILGAPFYLRSLVRYGTLQTNGYGASAWQRIIGPERPGPGLRSFVPAFAERFMMRFWGGIGWPEGPKLPEWITDPWFVGFAALTVVGILVGIGGRWGRWVVLVPAIPAVLSIGLMAGSVYHLYSTHGGVLPGIQGRYGYGYVVPLAAPFALGLAWLLRERVTRWLPLLVLLAALATQLAAWLYLVRAWWVPTGTNGDRGRMLQGAIEAIDRWSPWPAAVTATPFVLTVLLVPAVVGVVFLSCRRSRLPAPAGHHPPGDDERPPVEEAGVTRW